MTTTTRRGMLSIAGQSAAMAAFAAAPGVARATPPALSEIQRRLVVWARAVRTCEDDPRDSEDPGWEALLIAANDRLTEAMDVAAVTAEDLAIKTYLLAYDTIGGTTRDTFRPYYEMSPMDEGLTRNLVENAISLSPLLRSIVERRA